MRIQERTECWIAWEEQVLFALPEHCLSFPHEKQALERNPHPALLSGQLLQADEQLVYTYHIPKAYHTLQEAIHKQQLSLQDWWLCFSLYLELQRHCQTPFLNAQHLVLDPKRIYWNQESFLFLYCPFEARQTLEETENESDQIEQKQAMAEAKLEALGKLVEAMLLSCQPLESNFSKLLKACYQSESAFREVFTELKEDFFPLEQKTTPSRPAREKLASSPVQKKRPDKNHGASFYLLAILSALGLGSYFYQKLTSESDPLLFYASVASFLLSMGLSIAALFSRAFRQGYQSKFQKEHEQSRKQQIRRRLQNLKRQKKQEISLFHPNLIFLERRASDLQKPEFLEQHWDEANDRFATLYQFPVAFGRLKHKTAKPLGFQEEADYELLFDYDGQSLLVCLLNENRQLSINHQEQKAGELYPVHNGNLIEVDWMGFYVHIDEKEANL